MATTRILADGEYLLLAPNLPLKGGCVEMITERNFLVQNIKNFMQNNPWVTEDI